MSAPALLPEREQYAAWKAEELAKFLAEHPDAPDWLARDAAEGVASLMLSRAKRAGLFVKAAEMVTADPEPPLSSERFLSAGADLAPGSGAREGSGTAAVAAAEREAA